MDLSKGAEAVAVMGSLITHDGLHFRLTARCLREDLGLPAPSEMRTALEGPVGEAFAATVAESPPLELSRHVQLIGTDEQQLVMHPSAEDRVLWIVACGTRISERCVELDQRGVLWGPGRIGAENRSKHVSARLSSVCEAALRFACLSSRPAWAARPHLLVQRDLRASTRAIQRFVFVAGRTHPTLAHSFLPVWAPVYKFGPWRSETVGRHAGHPDRRRVPSAVAGRETAGSGKGAVRRSSGPTRGA